jgi:hypothetical protein
MICELWAKARVRERHRNDGSKDDCRCRSESSRRSIVTARREAPRDFIVLRYLSFWFEDLAWRIQGSVILRTFGYQ